MLLFASDLDNTMIFSYKRLAGDAVCVEQKDGKSLSYMTHEAYNTLQELAERVLFVPVTTRSVEQYRRINLLKSGSPRFALTSNGGTLLEDGEINSGWQSETLCLIADCLPELEKGIRLLRDDAGVTMETRLVDDVFVFTKTDDFAQSAARLSDALDLSKITIERNGNKIYLLPKVLTKGKALERLRQWKGIEADRIAAAGDSTFDIPMLMKADYAIMPKIQELSLVETTDKKVMLYRGDPLGFAQAVLEHVENIRRSLENSFERGLP